MESFKKHAGVALALDRINVDTDQIIPKQFLKRIERTGFGEFLFYDWRFHADGSLRADFELNLPRFQEASILVAGSNFGCGSSREHAAWALLDYGFRSVIAPSFADIFFNNCFKNGVLPVRLTEAQVREIMRRIQSHPGYRLTVDLKNQTVTDDLDFKADFEVDVFRRRCLLEGLDEIALTLQLEDAIRSFEKRRRTFR